MNTNVNVNIAKDLNVNVARELKRAYPDRRKLECQVMEVTTMMIFNLDGGDDLHACFLVQLSIATNNLHFGSRILDDYFLQCISAVAFVKNEADLLEQVSLFYVFVCLIGTGEPFFMSFV